MGYNGAAPILPFEDDYFFSVCLVGRSLPEKGHVNIDILFKSHMHTPPLAQCCQSMWTVGMMNCHTESLLVVFAVL